MKGKHFNKFELKEHDFTIKGKRTPLYLNEKADQEDLDFEILHSKEATPEERLNDLVLKVNRKMSTLQDSMIQAQKQKPQNSLSP